MRASRVFTSTAAIRLLAFMNVSASHSSPPSHAGLRLAFRRMPAMPQSTPFAARPYVLHEANLKQVAELKPNVAVLPWGATEAHNYHMPHGTDNVQAVAVGERAVARANAAGARCVLLPCIPFGNDNAQLKQVATITMRTRTQAAVLTDIADSLVRQGIDRLVLFNFHGGNEFKPLIRDVMMD